MRRHGRGRPLLGAAVVIGASRSAAKHEVAKQAQLTAEAQASAQRAAEAQRREEEKNDKRTQQAIDEAIAKERGRIEQAEIELRNATANTGGARSSGLAGDPPIYSTNDRGVETGQKMELDTHYCPQCRNVCRFGDKFCNRCGCKQPAAEVGSNIAAQDMKSI